MTHTMSTRSANSITTEILVDDAVIGRIVEGFNVRTKTSTWTPRIWSDGKELFAGTPQRSKAKAFGCITGYHAQNVA